MGGVVMFVIHWRPQEKPLPTAGCAVRSDIRISIYGARLCNDLRTGASPRLRACRRIARSRSTR